MQSFEKVLDGAVRFFNEEIAPSMSDWQEVLARIAIGKIYESQPAIVQTLQQNGIVRAFGIMDANGNVDTERLSQDLAREIRKKEKLQLAVPGFGKFTFTSADVEKLFLYIKEA